MTYSQYGTIQATDFNTFVGGNPTTTANTLNSVWATGGSLAGYGQTAVANVSAGNVVVATNAWNSLVTYTSNSATHQGSSITAVTAPVSGNTITYNSSIPTNLQTIYTNKLNAASQSGTSANTVTTVATWTNNAVWTQTATFANGDAARYFFNSGGQFKITIAHSNTAAGINLQWNQLASNVGTVAVSAMNSGTANIAGTIYNGITKVGGGGTAPTISQNSGYYGLSVSNANVFTQVTSTGPAGYTNSFVNIRIKTNGAQGVNGDVGNIITFYTTWQEASNVGLTVGTGSSVTITAVPPEVTNISNSWGTITLAGSVALV